MVMVPNRRTGTIEVGSGEWISLSRLCTMYSVHSVLCKYLVAVLLRRAANDEIPA